MKRNSFSKTVPAIACMLLSIYFTPALAQQGPRLSDAEIASVAVTANQIDIDYAEIARKRSGNAKVLQFAETMISDHKSVINQAVALVTKLGVTPEDNPVSQQLLTDAAKMKKSLNAKRGKSFDKAYIDNEVTYHQSVIAAVEGLLIPGAQNPELKQLLQNIMPALKIHLGHAMMLQSELSK